MVSLYAHRHYLITPIIKPFVVAANDRDLEIALFTLFLLLMLLPTISDYVTPIERYLLLPHHTYSYICLGTIYIHVPNITRFSGTKVYGQQSLPLQLLQ